MSVRFALVFCLFAGIGNASATETEWTAASGDWSTSENWTNGEPIADCRALVANGNATITQAGEVCSELRVGPDSGTIAFLQMNNGTLDVSGAVLLDRGVMSQFNGASNFGRLHCGGESTGSFTQGNGFVAVGTLVAGSSEATGTYSLSTGTLDVSDSTIVNRFGSIVLSGFNTTSALGHVTVAGGFSVANGSNPIAAESLVMAETARTLLTVGPGVISLIDVNGAVVIDGSLQIQDPQDVADGTYELFRGSSITGGFSSEDLPGDRWSWFVEGNSLFIRKGDPTPVTPTTWGSLKRARTN